MKLSKNPFVRHVSSSSFALASLLLFTAFAVTGKELPYGIRNAFASEDKPFLRDFRDGKFTVNSPGRAGLGQELRIEVVNFNLWRTNQNASLRDGDLTLYLDRQAIKGLHIQRYPENDWEEIPAVGTTNAITYFGVRLEQTAENRAAWKALLHSPKFDLTRPVEVSLGYAGAEPMNTWVYPTALYDGMAPFSLVILSQGRFWLGMAVIVGALFALIMLACRTDLLRDSTLPQRPDGRMQLSLGRSQMAFWFFLVFSAFFFLWLVTGYTDTLNSSIITLIGISAGTAVGSAFIDLTKKWKRDAKVAVDPAGSETRAQTLARLTDELTKVRVHLKQVNPPLDEQEQLQLQNRAHTLEEQVEFFRWPPWRVALQDLLNEDGVVSFHRFQMVAWTLVLGVIFVTDVYAKGTMPAFDATLLGLMGVSAGTFLGFKIPSPSRQ